MCSDRVDLCLKSLRCQKVHGVHPVPTAYVFTFGSKPVKLVAQMTKVTIVTSTDISIITFGGTDDIYNIQLLLSS